MLRGRRIARWTIITGAIAFPLICIATCIGPPGYYLDKYSAVTVSRPFSTPNPICPEKQTEPHTCGLHSLSSIYTAYGLNPEELRLRFRTGVDKPVTNFLSDSTGVIHPDMFRVLQQDGFETMLLRPSDTKARACVAEHLDQGQFVIALTKVNEFHWVVLAAHRGGNVEICDSLHEEMYEEPLSEYLRDRVYSLVLVKPASSSADR